MAAIDEGMEDLTIENLAADVMELMVEILAVKMRLRTVELRDSPIGPHPCVLEGMSQEQIERGHDRLLMAIQGIGGVSGAPILGSQMLRATSEAQTEQIERLAAEITSLRKRMAVDAEHLSNAQAMLKQCEGRIKELYEDRDYLRETLSTRNRELRASTTTDKLVVREVRDEDGQVREYAIIQQPQFRQVGVAPTLSTALRFIADAMEKKQYGY